MNKDIKAVLGKLRAFLRLGGLQCGTSPRDRKTGTDLYVWIMQASALLPAVYLFILSGYPALDAGRNIPAFLFEAGIASLPRTEAHLLACLYRWTARETLLHMALLIAALVFGRDERAEKLAEEKHLSVSEIAMRYVFSSPMNLFAVVSTASPERMRMNIRAAAHPLSPEEVRYLEED